MFHEMNMFHETLINVSQNKVINITLFYIKGNSITQDRVSLIAVYQIAMSVCILYVDRTPISIGSNHFVLGIIHFLRLVLPVHWRVDYANAEFRAVKTFFFGRRINALVPHARRAGSGTRGFRKNLCSTNPDIE